MKFRVLSVFHLLLPMLTSALAGVSKPNIIIILADDLGIGDVKCYGKELCKISTPNIDRLAKKGRMFTDAHTCSSVCTPSRYGLLTGRYNWRSTRKQGVLNGFDRSLIPVERETLSSFLQKQGYATACIGKWHLGMDFPTTSGRNIYHKVKKIDELDKCNVDWNGKIKNGPTAVGFDYYYGISASLDFPPYIWIENDRFVGKATTIKAFHRPGPAHIDFEAIDVLPSITRKSVEYIRKQANAEKPFFLYVSLNSPHTPILPSKVFQGKSPIGPYGDFVMETDWSVGEMMKEVEKNGIADNTLFIVTSDNGCSPAAQRKPQSANLKFNIDKPEARDPEGHYANGIYRGHKADLFEGGHRVPFVARWDGRVKADSICDNLICLTDLFSTVAEIVNRSFPDTVAEDSISFLSALLGTAKENRREAIVHHSWNGSFSIRENQWKLLFCPGSGGWSDPTPPTTKWGRKVDPSIFKEKNWMQLYELGSDPAELHNHVAEQPKTVKHLTELMNRFIKNGRSTLGKTQANDGRTTHLYPKWIRETL